MPTFEPPYEDLVPPVPPRGGHVPRHERPMYRLLRHYKNRAAGLSVLKFADGTYRTVQTPSQDLVDTAVEFYQGGHVYEVSVPEAAALVGAGYDVAFTTPYPSEGLYPSGSLYPHSTDSGDFDGAPSESLYPSDSLVPSD